MTKNFFECAKSGGKIINKRNKDGKVIKTCYDKEGNSYVKPDKKKKNRRKNKNTKFISATQDSINKLAEHFNNNNLK